MDPDKFAQMSVVRKILRSIIKQHQDAEVMFATDPTYGSDITQDMDVSPHIWNLTNNLIIKKHWGSSFCFPAQEE